MGRGTLSNADCKLRAFCKLQTTSYKLRATCRFQKPPPHPSPKGRGRCFAVTNPWINGAAWAPARGCSAPLAGDSFSPFHWLNTDSLDEAACRPRSGVHAARTAKTLSPSSRSRRRPVRNELRATGHPVTFTTHYEQRTTNPRGGHMGPPLRQDKPQATSCKPQATCRCFVIPAKRAPRLARASLDRRSPRRS